MALAQAQADLDVKQATLDKLRAGPTASDLASANAAVKDAQTALQNSQFNLTVVQNSSTVTQALRDREYEANWYEANYGDSLQKYQVGRIDKNRLDLDYNNLMTAKERLETARTQAALCLGKTGNALLRR